MILTAMVLGWGILATALTDGMNGAYTEKQEAGGRLVFAHFMVCMGPVKPITCRGLPD